MTGCDFAMYASGATFGAALFLYFRSRIILKVVNDKLRACGAIQDI
jgi:hypothetical protein